MRFIDEPVMSQAPADEPDTDSEMTLWLVKPEDKELYSLDAFSNIKHAIEEAAENAISTPQDWASAITSAEAMAQPYMTMNVNNPLFSDGESWKAFRVDVLQPRSEAREFAALAIMGRDTNSGLIVLYVIRKPDNAPSDWHEVAITMLLRHYFKIKWISPSQLSSQIDASLRGNIVGTQRYRV